MPRRQCISYNPEGLHVAKGVAQAMCCMHITLWLVIAEPLTKYWVQNLSAINLLNQFQSAYPREYSTETDHLKMVNDLLPSFLPSGIVTSVSDIRYYRS